MCGGQGRSPTPCLSELHIHKQGTEKGSRLSLNEFCKRAAYLVYLKDKKVSSLTHAGWLPHKGRETKGQKEYSLKMKLPFPESRAISYSMG